MNTRRGFLKKLAIAFPMAALATELNFANILEPEEVKSVSRISPVIQEAVGKYYMEEETLKAMEELRIGIEEHIWHGEYKPRMAKRRNGIVELIK